MTVQAPALTDDELRDARDAWMLALLGQPIPTQYRPAAAKVAAYCLARAYDHDEAAEARPLFVHPDGGREGVPGVYGANRTWTPTELAAWVAKSAAPVREKGTGPMCSPGHSWRGDERDDFGELLAGAYPLPPLQRGDERCRSVGWLFLDADASGDWHDLGAALGAHGAAFVRSRSSGHCPGCAQHPDGAVKWHLALPLREPWETTGALNADRARWKSELYPAARFALHLAGDLTGRGFDRELAQFLCRFYVGSPRDAAHRAVPREVLGREGLGFDVEACFAGLETLGVVDPAEVRAARTAGQFAPGRAWDLDDGTPPMVAAFLVAGLYGRQLPNGNHVVVCPWEDLHSGGEALDTSTILFPNGKFHCSHSHAEGKAADGAGMREVLAMLPPEAQAAHEEARRQGRARLAMVPAWGRAESDVEGRPSAPPPCVDVAAEADALRAILRDELEPAPRPGDPPRAWQRIAAVVQPGDFADPAHAAVFAAMGRAKAGGRPLIAPVIRDELRAARASAAVLAAADALSSGVGGALAGPLADAAALVVADLGARRRLGKALGDSMRALIAGRPLAETHGDALRKVREVRLPGVRLPTMREEMEAAGKRMDARRAGDVDRVLRSSVHDLNDALEGGWRAGLTLIGARPFIGKTVLTTQEAVFTAAHAGPVLYLTYESRRPVIVDGMISFLSGVPLDKVKAPAAMTQAEYDAVDQAMATLERLPITIVDLATPGAPRTVPQIEASMLALPAPPVMVAIDHIRKLSPTGRHSEVRHALGEISAGLHELAMDHGVAVLALIHVGRAAVKGQLARMPTMEDFKESGDLEENTDGAVILHNEGRYPTRKYADNEKPSLDFVEAFVPKVRGGRGGGYAKMRLRGDVQRFVSTMMEEHDLEATPDAEPFSPRVSMVHARAPGPVSAGDGIYEAAGALPVDPTPYAGESGYLDLGPQYEEGAA